MFVRRKSITCIAAVPCSPLVFTAEEVPMFEPDTMKLIREDGKAYP